MKQGEPLTDSDKSGYAQFFDATYNHQCFCRKDTKVLSHYVLNDLLVVISECQTCNYCFRVTFSLEGSDWARPKPTVVHQNLHYQISGA